MAGVGESLGYILVLLGLLVLGLTFVVSILVSVNFRGIRDWTYTKGRRIPGFRSQTPWKATIASLGYLVIVAVFMFSAGAMLVPAEPVEIQDTAISPTSKIMVGDSIEVTGTVVNEGNETEFFTLEMSIGAEVVDSQEFELDPGEIREVRFSAVVDESGEHAIKLNEKKVGTLSVATPTPTTTATRSPSPTPTFSPTPSPSPTPEPAQIKIIRTSLAQTQFDVGKSTTVSATVRNVGERSGTKTYFLRINGNIVGSKEVVVPAGETRTIRFSHEFRGVGDHRVKIGDTKVGTVTTNLPFDYSIIEIRDVSYATVVRFSIAITPENSLDDFSQRELIWIAQDIVNRVISEKEVNAIGISFFEESYHYGPYPHCVGIDWAPFGEWERADDVDTGDYEHHELDLYDDYRDDEDFSWCD